MNFPGNESCRLQRACSAKPMSKTKFYIDVTLNRTVLTAIRDMNNCYALSIVAAEAFEDRVVYWNKRVGVRHILENIAAAIVSNTPNGLGD